jgi:DNA-binding MarR family transcriptional regulator
MCETRKLLGKLRRLTNLMQRARTKEFSNHDFNMMDGKGRLLSVLQQKDGLTQRELGEELDIRPSSVGELVRKLEANGLVIRQNNKDDRRVMNVYLTEIGRELIENNASLQTEIQANLFQDISEDEKEVFARVLEKMIVSLEDEYSIQDADFMKSGRRHLRGGKGRGNRRNDDRKHRNQGNRRGLGRRQNNEFK